MSTRERSPRRPGPGPTRQAILGRPPGWSSSRRPPNIEPHGTRVKQGVLEALKRRGTAIGDQPEKQGGAEVLLGKHRGLTALMCCSRRERQAWPRRHRAGTLNSERTGRRERPAVVSETRGHCCACPSPSKAPRASFLSGWWSSSTPWPYQSSGPL